MNDKRGSRTGANQRTASSGLSVTRCLPGFLSVARDIRSVLIILVALLVILVASACGSGGQAASKPAVASPTGDRPAAELLQPTPEIEPVRFPEDEAPHNMLTEWWYYTGHLFTPDGTRYGFEYVFFQSQRGAFPSFYAAHFAITDSSRDTFRFDEKAGIDAARPVDQGFSFALDDWTMSGALGNDHLQADLDKYAMDVALSATKPPVLHNETGYVDSLLAGGSYYYTRPRMAVSGTLTIEGTPHEVTGEAWMDHQWGNFVVAGAGGWDWFSIQMDNGQDLMLFHIWTSDGEVPLSFGTLIEADGGTRHLTRDEFTLEPTGEWTSALSGITYPSGWTVQLPAEDWSLVLEPSVLDQELRTRETGVTYWEGEIVVSGMIDGNRVDGLGYVELNGYAPIPADSSSLKDP